MSAADFKGISIDILGKQHQFTCSAEQAEDLKKAASRLVTMCNDIKQSGSGSNERALLVASLNLSYSLLMANNKIEHYQQKHSDLLASLKNAVEH